MIKPYRNFVIQLNLRMKDIMLVDPGSQTVWYYLIIFMLQFKE